MTFRLPRSSFCIRSLVVLALGVGLAGARAQEAKMEPPASLSKEAIEAAAAIQPPVLPDEAAAKVEAVGQPPVAPPKPGEVDAPAVETGSVPGTRGNRIPEEWIRAQKSSVVPPVPAGPGEVTKSTSTSGQFIVHGTALQVRNGVARRCEEVAEKLRKVMKDKTPWVLPIVVHLKGAEESPKKGPTVSTQITEMAHGGFHLQLTVLARSDLRLKDLESELFRVLLAERILRNQKAIVSKRERLLPDWLFTGVVEAARYRERTRPSALFSILFESGKIYGIEEIIEASPMQMDSLSRAIYDTSCCALVLALLDQGEGAERIAKFLNSLASDSRSERELLNQWFPSVAASPTSLNKWWALQMATLAQPTVSEPLGPNESYEAIKAALVFAYEAPLNKAPPSAQPDLSTPAPSIAATPPPIAPKPKPTVKRESKPASKPVAEVADSGSTDEDGGTEVMKEGDGEPKPGTGKRTVFGRLSEMLAKRKASSDEEEQAEAVEEVAAMETEDVPVPQEPEPAPEEPEPEPEPAAEPQEMAKAEVEPEEAEAGSKKEKFNLLRWIRSKRSDGEEEPAETEDPEDGEEAMVQPNRAAFGIASVGDSDWLRWISPVAGSLLNQRHGWLSDPAAPRQVFLKFFKKKKDGEEEGEGDEDEETESKPEEAKITEEESSPSPAPEKKAPTPPAPKSAPKPAPKKPAPVDLSKVVPLVKVRSPFSEYAWIMNRKDKDEILDRPMRVLQGLETRVGVLYRPIVIGYLAVIEQLRQGKTKGVEEALKALEAQLEGARMKSKEVRDYLDWYEASHSGSYSGLFDEYLNLSETIKQETPSRTDPISKYLDALEAEFAD